MNINTTNIDTTTKTQENNNSTNSTKNSSSASFSDELKELESSATKQQQTEEAKQNKEEKVEESKIEENVDESKAEEKLSEKTDKSVNQQSENQQEDVKNAINGLNSVVEEISNCTVPDKSSDKENKNINEENITTQQSIENENIFIQDEQSEGELVTELKTQKKEAAQNIVEANNKNNNIFKAIVVAKEKSDVKNEDEDVINNNDMNIQKNKDILPQVSVSTGFSGNGQPFSSLMGQDDENNNSKTGVLNSTQAELEEESKILSTMAENIAIANKHNIVKDTVVKSDAIIMNAADVEVFTNIVNGAEINMNNLTSEATEKSVAVSKTLADMLAKSMENNKPLRVDFDNDISVIIKISREGKISADFLPSSQVAEAYLKENLPLLKQRFDDNNIEYDELNQRNQRNRDRENDNKKKGRRDE